MSPQKILATLFLVAIWFPVLTILELEWRLNAQYQYGYFVPFFTLYLLYLRWEDRPAPGSQRGPGWTLLLPILAYIPLQLIQTANPDWRLVYLVATVLALGITVAWITHLGGRQWGRHFAPALAMMLFAVPWMTGIENQITRSLMAFVSSFTVEVLNLAGIYAVQAGNVILLQGAVVGVEEACSGVRSFQSALMAGYLFGEILRFRIPIRVLLLFLGATANFILNLGRTLTLTSISLNLGPEAFDAWHDFVGNGVAIGGFLSVAILAWGIGRIPQSRTHPATKAGIDAPTTSTLPNPTRSPLCILYPFAIAGVLLSVWIEAIWYAPIEDSDPQFDYHRIQWDAVATETVALEMDPIAVAQLKFSEGAHHTWVDEQGIRWTAFYFNWRQGRISSHAGIHRPENCLPASGVSLTATHETFLWESPEGFSIPFQSMTFEGLGRTTHVFFAVWDENGAEPWVSTTWKERLADVWNRRVVTGRHSLQFLAENAPSLQHAQDACSTILDRMYQP